MQELSSEDGKVKENIQDQSISHEDSHLLRILVSSYLENKKIIFTKRISTCDFQNDTIWSILSKLGELSFQCLDCGIDKDSHLICKDCFSTQIHKNHKIKYSTDNIGSCDCGDYQAIANSGCCLNHRGNPNQFSQKEELWDRLIPKNFRENYEQMIVILISMILEKTQDCTVLGEKINKQNISYQDMVSKIVYHIIETIIYFMNEASILTSLTGYILNQKITSKNIKLAQKLTHNCIDYESPISKQPSNQQTCSCSFLELLFRISCKLDYNANEIMCSMLLIIFKNDQNFTNKLIQTYSKMFKMLIYQTKSCPGLHVSGFFDLYAQFFTKQCSEIWLKDQQIYLNNIYEKTIEIITLYFSPLSRFSYNTFNKIKQIYLFWLKKDQLACNLNYKKIDLKCVFLTQKKSSPHLEDEVEKCRLHIECSLLLIIKQLIYKIYVQPSEKQTYLLQFFLQTLIKEAQTIDYLKIPYTQQLNSVPQQQLQNKQDQGCEWPIHYTGIRVISIIMNILIMEQGHHYLKQLLQQILKGQEYYELIQNMIICSLKALRFARLTEQKVGTFYDLLNDPQKSMKIEIINSFYKKSYYGQYDLDIALIQTLFSLSLQSEKGQQVSIMNTITQVYGEIDIKKIYFMADNEEYKKNLACVLELIVALIIDSTSFINSVACTRVLQQKTDQSRPPWLLKHLENVVINSFHIHKSKDLRTVKEVLFDKILNYEIHLEDFINNVAVYNQNTNHLRLKPEYEQCYEPYMFNKYTRLNQDLFEKIKTITNKNPQLDHIMSTMNLYEHDSFQRQLMDILFSDEVPRIEGLNSNLNEVLRHSIKLVSSYLQFCKKEIDYGDFDEDRIVFDNLLKYYLKPEMEAKIEEMKNNPNLKELKQTFVNIQKLIEQLREELMKRASQETTIKLRKSTSQKQEIIDKQEKCKEQIVDKSKLLKLKKEQIKKNFLEKQKKFMNKNQQLVNNLPEQQEQKDNDQNQNEVCNICHDLLPGTKYGVYSYISNDNLIQFCSPLLDNRDTGYNIQSCNHFLHKHCNEDILESNLKNILQKSYLFNYKFEVLCGHCKFMANIFVQFMNDKNSIYFKDFKLNQMYSNFSNQPKHLKPLKKSYSLAAVDLANINNNNNSHTNNSGSINNILSNSINNYSNYFNSNHDAEEFSDNSNSDKKNNNINNSSINHIGSKNSHLNINKFEINGASKKISREESAQKSLSHSSYSISEEVPNKEDKVKSTINPNLSKKAITGNKKTNNISNNDNNGNNVSNGKKVNLHTSSLLPEIPHLFKNPSSNSNSNYKANDTSYIVCMEDIINYTKNLSFQIDENFDTSLIAEELFDHIQMIFRSQNAEQQKQIIKKEWILNCCFQLLFYTSHNIGLGGLTLYFKKSVLLYRNIYLNFRQYFFYYLMTVQEEEFKEGYTEELKFNFITGLKTFFNQTDFITTIDSLRSQENLYFQLIWYSAVLFKDDEVFLLKCYLLLTQRFFRMMVVLHFIAYTEKQNPNIDQKRKQSQENRHRKFSLDQECAQKKFFNFQSRKYDQNYFIHSLENEEFKYELVNFLLPFCRKTIGIFFTIFKAKQKDMDILDMDQFGSDQNEFDTYVNLMDEVCGAMQVFHLFLDEELIKGIQNNDGVMAKAKTLYRSGYQNFTIVSLPHNYLDFQRIYNTFTCDICQEFPRVSDPYLCLVCEKVLCSVRCYKYDQSIMSERHNRKVKKRGNINSHAIDVHMGKCAYLHLQRGVVILVSYPKIVSYGHMYQDIYGQLPNVKNMNWEDYQINFKLHNRIQDLIISQRIPQEITYKLMKDEMCLFQKDYV